MYLYLTLHVVYLQVLTSTGSQSQGDPTHVPPALKNFSISHKEKTLDELVRDQWLTHTSDGNIGLGVRSFLDLRSYFHNNDIPSCQVCNEAGVKVNSLLLCYVSGYWRLMFDVYYISAIFYFFLVYS